MAKDKKKYLYPAGFLLLIVYFFAASRPVPPETVLRPQWIVSLESGYPLFFEGESAPEPDEDEGRPLPFILGNRFGYFNRDGGFDMNRTARGNAAISENYWTEYEAAPSSLEIRELLNEAPLKILEPRGYPFFMDKRIFIISEEQNSLTALDSGGNSLWTYDFAAPLTDVDAAAGLVLTGSLDGVVNLLDMSGRRVFSFEIGGSRYSAVYGCRISRDGSKLALVAGFDDQRFLLMEKIGDSYKVAYHEFFSGGFRRPVHISFIDNDRWVVFESEGLLVLYNIGARDSIKLPLEGNIIALDGSGADKLLFALTSLSPRKKQLVEIRLPGEIIMKAPFSSENAFLARRGRRLYLGGGGALASLSLSSR
ncbi:MAG: WD40 repeat domain-containing protein [Treponema sp.]|jgi:hypothetical protein|nr:WD40 repeat domain-containing protein [Treponema sp.]